MTTGESTSTLRVRLPALIVGLLVLVFIGLVAYALQRSQRTSELGVGGRINTVGTLVRFMERAAPDFVLPDLRGGAAIRLADYRGKIVVLNFWASWCPPCREEAPILREFARRYAESGVVIVGIDVWEKNWNDGRAFLDEFGVPYPNAYDTEGRVTIDYGVSGVPETFFISPDGRLLGKYTGPVKSVEQLLGLLNELGVAPATQ
ncbi:MAG: TlpA family protein disulfide reductase [Thermomicrobium sp.]